MNPAPATATPESSEAAIHTATVFHALAELGAILLLFSAGLESSVTRMKQVGGQALSVAVVGVVATIHVGLQLRNGLAIIHVLTISTADK